MRSVIADADSVGISIPARGVTRKKPKFIKVLPTLSLMDYSKPIPGLLLVILAFVVAVLLASLMQPITGKWDTVLFVIVLFFLLWAIASKRNWAIPFTLPFIRSSAMSDVILGLLLTLVALAVSWFVGTAISHAFSDLLGALMALVIFGVIMLVVSSARNWQ
jgi:membrane glycosyltransferase